MSDPLAAVADLPGVAVAVLACRERIDGMLWDRRLRNRPDLARRVADAEASASAALDGADSGLPLIEAADETPMGRVLASAARVTDAAADGANLLLTSPLQLIARLGAQAAAGFLPTEELGRPRTTDTADDPLRLGPPPPAEQLRPRLAGLARTLTTETAASGIVLAAIAHAELLTLRPFEFGSGIVARGAQRAGLRATGVDPGSLIATSAGWLALGRPSYVAALRAYATSTADGVATWLKESSTAMVAAVERTVAMLD